MAHVLGHGLADLCCAALEWLFGMGALQGSNAEKCFFRVLVEVGSLGVNTSVQAIIGLRSKFLISICIAAPAVQAILHGFEPHPDTDFLTPKKQRREPGIADMVLCSTLINCVVKLLHECHTMPSSCMSVTHTMLAAILRILIERQFSQLSAPPSHTLHCAGLLEGGRRSSASTLHASSLATSVALPAFSGCLFTSSHAPPSRQ